MLLKAAVNLEKGGDLVGWCRLNPVGSPRVDRAGERDRDREERETRQRVEEAPGFRLDPCVLAALEAKL
jgi:hypothetical protein